ncbi:Endonuclease/exonuclease/phosphatase [Flagelloscypha sp. PMI_526]|nr:Endonuclease/exonuclease/phosphatase [Flagelloscypha sp. PMI_526]
MKSTWTFVTLLTAIHVAAQTSSSGTFNVLSMNVAGLPSILNPNEGGDKTTNTMIIGQRMAQYAYNLIHVQEDFNYHATLYQYDNHTYRTATSGGVPFGSGLNTLATSSWIDDERIKWNTCSDASESDCLTPKGFTFMRWQVTTGVYIDAYNLHADAGTETEDLSARASNLNQVASYIATNSVGNAVLVFGDTNSRYTRTGDIVPSFISQTATTDAWVKLVRGGVNPIAGTDALLCPDTTVPTSTACETVDKVFFRSSKALTLTATSFVYDTSRFLNSTGGMLSDHHPVRVEFTWTASSSFRTGDLYGGPHGDWFNDLSTLPSSPLATSVTLRGGSRLDAISFTLSSGATLSHGGTGGTAYTLTLSSSNYVTSAKLCWGQKDGDTRIFYALLTTNTGATVSAGTTTSDCAATSAPSGWKFVATRGRSGDEVDRLGFIFVPI